MRPAPGDYQAEALDFLTQSLKDFEDRKWKYSVLHAGMAVEMLLKERLVKVSPGVVLERIDEPDCRTTVRMSRIIPRLETLGIRPEQSDCRLIGKIAEWRNDVAHWKLRATESDVRRELSAIFKFFSRFLLAELGARINEKLGATEYRKFRELLREWDDVVKEAQEEAAEAGHVDDHMPPNTYDCPECWGPPQTVAIKDGKAHCFLCDQDFESTSCSRCGEAIIGEKESLEEGPTWCESCTEHVFSAD